MKKALLINPPTGMYIRDDRCQVPVKGLSSALRMPLDLAYMAAAFEKYGWACKIGDYQAMAHGEQELFDDLQQFEPDFVVISTTTPTLLNDLAICEHIRESVPDATVVIKGAHVTVEAEIILETCPCLDIAIKQEYEQVIEELAQNKKWQDIDGIVFRQKDKVIVNPDRKYLENLDELPFPARSLLKNELYVRPDTGETQTSIMTSRGCPQNCTFCLVRTVSGVRVNTRSVDSVIEELRSCVEELGITNFYFRADTFTWNKEWVIELCKKIRRSDLDINWVCNSRIDTIDEKLINDMKRSGCWMVGFGLESGDQKLLDKMKKGIRVETMRKTLKLCKKYGLSTYLFFVYGLPWETKESLQKTLKLAKELDGDFVEFHQAYPFPGTEYHDFALEHKLFSKADLTNTDVFSSPASSFTLSSGDLNSFCKKATRSYYLRPRYILRAMNKIDSWKKFKNYTKKGMSILFRR
jgi:anaerobic magnesium-protoporphyrin IX monomethyl ester cyclase